MFNSYLKISLLKFLFRLDTPTTQRRQYRPKFHMNQVTFLQLPNIFCKEYLKIESIHDVKSQKMKVCRDEGHVFLCLVNLNYCVVLELYLLIFCFFSVSGLVFCRLFKYLSIQAILFKP